MTRLSDLGDVTSVDGVTKVCLCPHDQPVCEERMPNRKYCTMPDGHAGPHVACGGHNHQYVVVDADGNVRDEYDRFQKNFYDDGGRP